MSAILESRNVHQWYPQLIHIQHISYCTTWSVFDKTPEGGTDHLPWSWHICLSIEYRSRNRQWNLWALCFLLMMPGMIKILVIYDMYSNV